MIAVTVSYRVFNCLKACFFCTHFLRIFIINGCWILLNVFPAPIEVIVWLLSFILIMWCIKLVDLQTLKHLYISGINPTWSYSTVVQSLSHVQLCDPMDCSMPGFFVLYHLQELPQIHVHWSWGPIQLSCPLSSPSPPAFDLSQHQGLF